ncbi:hypothetical protein VHEMI10001 [[Torrubiella] hemipterigena]|uniref:Mpv17/PMP22 family protein n=1 Tax=[Torrubiella] hemipterigena TaxID=1531966 RepID=A0A0A1THP4_9HYPO|nr:hypothetical protein VHEMI10001 [[Torrubiella] hemipterigena]
MPKLSTQAYITATVQATALSALSWLLAQIIVFVRENGTKQIDYPMLWRFALYTALTTPPNLSFQGYLEDCFPSTTVRKRSAKSKGNGEKKTEDVDVVELDATNTLAKFVLDQTVSASVNTAMFIAVMGLLQAKAWEDVHGDVMKNFWPQLAAGYSFWPFVTLFNFTVVPFKHRALVGSFAGLLWGVFLSLMY